MKRIVTAHRGCSNIRGGSRRLEPMARRLVALAAFGFFVALLAACASDRGSRTAVLPTLLGAGSHHTTVWKVRPAEIVYAGDGSRVLGGFDGLEEGDVLHPGHLTWTTWTERQASGRGAVWLNDCTPVCADGKFTPHAVVVETFRPRDGHFTRLTLRYMDNGTHLIDSWSLDRSHGVWAYGPIK